MPKLNPLPQPNKPTVQQVQHIEQFCGPIPPPDTLERYNLILPGAAERILVMAEEEAKHRRQLEAMAYESRTTQPRYTFQLQTRGQYFGFFIGLTTILCGTYIVVSGYQWPGGILGTAGLAGLVWVFVRGNKTDTAKDKPAAK